MLASAQRMSRLIDDLLDLASLREGRLAMRRCRCAPADLLRGAVDELGAAAREKGLELSYSLPPALPDVHCDGDRLLQVLGNLASNAINATGHGQIRLAAERCDGEVVFSVSDTGPGISEEEQALLFEPFRRGAEAAYRGTGLGLAISRALVEAHGGRIWVESRPGEGATFRFTLPAASWEPARVPGCEDQAGGRAASGAAVAAAGER
jgi:signal transduction histidine kinase